MRSARAFLHRLLGFLRRERWESDLDAELASELYGVTPTDPVTFAAVLAILVLVTLIASYLPARRVTSIDPLAALRSD